MDTCSDCGNKHREVKFFEINEAAERLEYTEVDEAMEAFLERIWPARREDLPRKVKVLGFAPKAVVASGSDAESVLEDYLEHLDEKYGDWDGSMTEPTGAMKEAAERFVDTVIQEYGDAWQCDEVCSWKIDLHAWIDRHAPDWPGLCKKTGQRLPKGCGACVDCRNWKQWGGDSNGDR